MKLLAGIAHRHAVTVVSGLLEQAGVAINGTRPWDIKIHDDRFFVRVLRSGGLGVGESYMDGWWDCDAIDQLVERVLTADVMARAERSVKLLSAIAGSRLLNRQAGGRGQLVADVHYDLPPDLFLAMLGSTMNYSCGYWRDAPDLDAAQIAKMDLICRKLQLSPRDHLIDIGCGWGGLARFAAENFGCRVTGITISREQQAFASQFCRGLPVHIHLMDYRDATAWSLDKADKIVSVGMFEHVGHRNYRRFISICRELLTEDGLFLLHSLGRTVDLAVDLWVGRYIFPNSYVPTMSDIAAMAHGAMIMEDWHNFGADYDKTLMAWHQRFEHWAGSGLKQRDKRWYRMWRYYLLSFAGCFRVRQRLQLWQIVFSKRGVAGGYRSVR